MLARSADGVRARRTSRFDRDLASAPLAIQRAFEKQLGYLLRDLRHPSLRAKKYDDARGIWQARVTLNWRFYFTIEGDTYTLLTIRSHPKYPTDIHPPAVFREQVVPAGTLEECRTPAQMRMVNGLCRFRELARAVEHPPA